MKGSKVLESGSFLNFATHTLHPVYLPIILSFWQSSEALLRVLRTIFFFLYMNLNPPFLVYNLLLF